MTCRAEQGAERVVVYAESDIWLGHGATQRRLFLEALLSMEWRVILLASESLAPIRETLQAFAQASGRLHAIAIPTKAEGYRVDERWRMIQALTEEAERATGWRTNLVILSWFDGLRPRRRDLKRCLGVMARPWVGLYFLPTAFRPGTTMGPVKRLRQAWVDHQLLRQPLARGLGVFDEGLGRTLRWASCRKPLVLMPEVTEADSLDSEEARLVRNLAGGRPIIALMGHLSPRKGVLNFLRASAGIDPGKAFFLLAGKFEPRDFSPAERRELEHLMAPRENLHLHLHHIGDAAVFNGLFSACDLHVLVYRDFFHSSGLLSKTAIFEKPVIVAEGHCMGERVRRFGLGWTVQEGDLAALRDRMLRALECTPEEALHLREAWMSYRTHHSATALRESLRRLCAPCDSDRSEETWT